MMPTRAPLHRQRGAAIVEFTIALPLLLLLMLATVELGRALFQYNTLTKAVRDGSRLVASRAAVGTTGVVSITSELLTEVRNVVVYGNVGGGGGPLLAGLTPVDVTVNDLGGGDVSVAATYAYTPLLGAQLPTLGIVPPIDMTFSMQATVVMRAL